MRYTLVGYGETRPDGAGSKRCYTEVKVYENESETEALKRAVQFVQNSLDAVITPKENPFAGVAADLIRRNQELQEQLETTNNKLLCVQAYDRDLRRERDEARKERDAFSAELEKLKQRLPELAKERDAVVKQLADLRDDLHALSTKRQMR